MSDREPTSQPTPPSVAVASRLTWWKAALAALSGLLLYACFPPADLGSLVWVALVPLLLALTQVRPLGGVVLGLIAGFAFTGPYGSFMLIYGRFEWFATAGFQALFFGLFGLLAALCNRSPHPAVRVLSVAAAWTLTEMFRAGIGGLGFTLGDLGYTQYDQLPLLQAAAYVGHFGLGLFIAALNAALAQAVLSVAPGVWVRPAVDPRRFAQVAARTALSGYVFILLLYLWGALVVRQRSAERGVTIETAVVQAVMGESDRATPADAMHALDSYLSLSQPIPQSIDLIVWPEVAVPDFLNLSPASAARIGDLARRKSAWVLAGAREYSPDGRIFNSLYAFSPEGEQTEIYRKVILVPFGESVPMRERFPWLARFTLRSVDFSPGERHRLLHIGEYRAGPLICFEGLFPHAVRANALLGADLIVLATSDAWAGGTSEIAQHSATAPLRAVEARKWVVRAGTWGRSQIISPWGEVVADVPIAQPGVAWHEIEPRRGLSTYHRYGDAPVMVACAVMMFAGLMGLPRRRGSPGHTDEQPERTQTED